MTGGIPCWTNVRCPPLLSQVAHFLCILVSLLAMFHFTVCGSGTFSYPSGPSVFTSWGYWCPSYEYCTVHWELVNQPQYWELDRQTYSVLSKLTKHYAICFKVTVVDAKLSSGVSVFLSTIAVPFMVDGACQYSALLVFTTDPWCCISPCVWEVCFLDPCLVIIPLYLVLWEVFIAEVIVTYRLWHWSDLGEQNLSFLFSSRSLSSIIPGHKIPPLLKCLFAFDCGWTRKVSFLQWNHTWHIDDIQM